MTIAVSISGCRFHELHETTKCPGRSAGALSIQLVELRGIEPLTFSMRTRRATNCAIAPWSGSRLSARTAPTETARLLACRPRQIVVAGEGDLIEMLEDRVLVVDIEDCGTRAAQS